MSAAAASESSRWSGIIPAARWLRSYEPAWFRPDLAAGVTLAAYLLPAALGDASLAGLPSEAGLYACLFGGLVFWLFCSSRQTSITVTSAISLLVGFDARWDGGRRRGALLDARRRHGAACCPDRISRLAGACGLGGELSFRKA
jgi:hypothetical protein